MKNKNLFLIIILIFFNFSFLFAQEKEHCNEKEFQCEKRREKIKVEKVTFLSNKLDLNVQEAQKFWAIYNEFEKKRDTLIYEKRNLMKKFDYEEKNLTELELEKIADRFVEVKLEEAKILKNFHKKMKNVLNIKKCLKFHKAEKEFHSHLLKRIGKRRKLMSNE